MCFHKANHNGGFNSYNVREEILPFAQKNNWGTHLLNNHPLFHFHLLPGFSVSFRGILLN